jgi:hypothetical protein
MVIESAKSHSITFPYYDDRGVMQKVIIVPGSNEVDDKVWKIVKKAFNEAYFKGLKESK